MYNPVYFNYGIAVHGADNVPNHPASHGCIRINMYLSDTFASYLTNIKGSDVNPRGDDIFVWNGVRDPESYGRRSGWFDRPDLAWRAEHSTTTTTTTTTTTAAPTTAAPAPTTTRPAATTTTTLPPTTTTTTTTLPATTTVAPGVSVG
jgi:hypothetical protein